MVLIWQVVGCSHREGKGYPLQYPCLENPMDREAWWARDHRVTKQFTFRSRVKQFSTHRMSPFSEVKWNPRKDMCPVSDCIRITEGCVKIKIPGAPSCHAEQGRLSCVSVSGLWNSYSCGCHTPIETDEDTQVLEQDGNMRQKINLKQL